MMFSVNGFTECLEFHCAQETRLTCRHDLRKEVAVFIALKKKTWISSMQNLTCSNNDVVVLYSLLYLHGGLQIWNGHDNKSVSVQNKRNFWWVISDDNSLARIATYWYELTFLSWSQISERILNTSTSITTSTSCQNVTWLRWNNIDLRKQD